MQQTPGGLSGGPGPEWPSWSRLLRVLREMAGITQDGWAARLAVGRNTVKRWEGGTAVPSPAAEQALIAICRAKGLFRPYDRGPLHGLTLTPDVLRDLLAEARLGGDASWGAAPPALPVVPPAPPRVRTNLPASTTRFVGRDRELGVVQDLLGASRLLTLTGTGGVGKTRLALEVAARGADPYPDGVWLVELAALTEPPLVARAVAAALGVQEQAQRPLTETLVAVLAARRTLLVLDNCEHLVAAAATLAERLLQGCPGVRILATSRQPLRVAGETLYRVPSLAAPAATGVVPPAQLARFDATRLFVERARAVQPAFALTEETARAVIAICRRLDGIPLALELAAARVRVLGVAQIAARLDDCLRLLTGGQRTALPRQQTLQAALDWSSELLGDPARVLLRRLAVFAGGWTLEAAEAVCAGDGVEAADVLDLLTQLVDQSLVVAEMDEGDARYHLLEPVRQYAGARLAASRSASESRPAATTERTALQARHARYHVAVAEEAEPRLRGPDQARWLARLAVEHDNLRAALAWSLAPGGDAALGLRLAAALAWFWRLHSHFREGRRWLEAALAATTDRRTADRAAAAGTPALARAAVAAQTGAGLLAYAQADFERATALLEAGLAGARASADAVGVAWALHGLGRVRHGQRDLAAARALLEESLAHGEQAGDRGAAGYSGFFLGMVLRDQGEMAQAARRLEGAVARFRETGDTWGLIWALQEWGVLARQLGDAAGAGARFAESLRLAHALGTSWGIAHALLSLGLVAHDQGQPDAAARLFGAAEALRELIGIPPPMAEYEQVVAALRTAVGEQAFAVAWGAGRALPLEQAVSVALAMPSPAVRPA